MSLQSCAEMVRRGDPDRFLATMAAPPDARARLFPLYAFNLEVARAPWVTEEPMLAEMRLQFWRDTVEEIAAGEAPRAHEVAEPLAGVVAAAELPAGPFDRLIEARRWDAYREPFPDRAAFDAHIDATSGGLTWLAARALGAREGVEEAVVRNFAYGAGVAGWLAAVPELTRRGRSPLVDGRPEAVAALAGDGLAAIRRARRRRGAVAKAAAPALLAGWRAGPVLKVAQAAPERVAEGGLQASSDFARRATLLLRAGLGRW